MNLFLGGSLAGLMRPHFFKKIGPVQTFRSMLRQNILWSASRAQVMQHEMVQRSIGQFFDHNNEEQDSLYTRPTLDLYFVTKYWGFLTKDLAAEEVADLEKAKHALEKYEQIYTIFEYGSEISQVMTLIETRIACNNPSVPMTIYRKSWHNQADKIFEEVELLLKAYYTLVDECAHSQAWVRKIEEDVGQNIAYMAISFDESVRDQLVERSALF